MSSKAGGGGVGILQPQTQYKEKLAEVYGTEPSKFKEQI